MTISVLDIGLGILIALFLVRGLLRGFINEVAGFVGLFLGLFVAGRFYPQLIPQFAGIIESQWAAAGVSYALLFAAVLIIVTLCATVVKRFLAMAIPLWVDHIFGSAIGAAKGIFICAIVLALMTRFVPDSPFLKNSVLAHYIEALVQFARSLLPAFLNSAV